MQGLYRASRKPYVEFVESLDLCEPEEVIRPVPEAFPVPGPPGTHRLALWNRRLWPPVLEQETGEKSLYL